MLIFQILEVKINKIKDNIFFFILEDFADFIRTTIGICGIMVILSVTIFAIIVNIYLNVKFFFFNKKQIIFLLMKQEI